MYRYRDFDVGRPEFSWEPTVTQDLELPTLFAAMAAGDQWLAKVIPKAVLASLPAVETIRYRQAVLNDCFAHEPVVRAMYDVAVKMIDAERKDYLGSLSHDPAWTLHRSSRLMDVFSTGMRRLREIADEKGAAFASEGFRTLFAMLQRELGDEYLEIVRAHLKHLKSGDRSDLISARLGEGNKGTAYVLRKEPPQTGNWFSRMLESGPPAYTFQLHPRDENGPKALGMIRNRGVNLVGNALAQAADHVLDFFRMLRAELAFYIGCLNVRAALAEQHAACCFPDPSPAGSRRHAASGLYDVALALRLKRPPVANDVRADDKGVVIVTGANQGGKSTFLRSIGLAQVMMQCGMFVGAESFAANVCERILTHYKREEDAAMESGKFDEELKRMSAIVDVTVPNSLVLFNESFASTNEREGSEIARQVVTALDELRVKVFFVTHQFEFAQGILERGSSGDLFLRAERRSDGARTFRVVEGAPEQMVHGEDLYREVFGPIDSRKRRTNAATLGSSSV